MSKLLKLPDDGRLLVSTDLHGNLEDFETLRDVWARDTDQHWLILGDIVHGPSDEAAAARPELCGYVDESPRLVREIASLCAEYPNVNVLLGNHDWSHIGGPTTRKFWTNEAAHLESIMSTDEVEAMHRFFHEAYLFASAPNGLFFSHGAAGVAPDDLGLLEHLKFDSRQLADRAVMNSAMCAYGQDDETMKLFLGTMSELVDAPLHVLVHGHDRDEDGWYTEGEHLACPVIFGARRNAKAYLELDLSESITHPDALERALRRLYG
jgi:serine/threonine-protein phosphatase PP1 catalytic subunit